MYEQLEAKFVEAGFRVQRLHEKVLFYKTVRREGNVCLTNAKLSFHATVYDLEVGQERSYKTVAFDITGEYRTDTWAELKVYALPWDQAVAELDKIQAELLSSWDAMCAVGRS